MLSGYLPGQEEGNVPYVVNGESFFTPMSLLSLVFVERRRACCCCCGVDDESVADVVRSWWCCCCLEPAVWNR